MSKADVEAFANIRDLFNLDVDLEDSNAKTDGRSFLDQPAKTKKENMITFKRLQNLQSVLFLKK